MKLWTRVRRRRLWAAALAAAVLVGAGVVYLARPDAVFGPQAVAGEVLPDRLDADVRRPTTIRVPGLEVDVAAADPVDDIEASSSYSSRHDATYDDIDAPSGGFWLPLRVASSYLSSAELFNSRSDVRTPAVTVTLRSGGHVVPVSRGMRPRVEGYLALPDGADRDDLVLRVEFDGVSQDVDLGTGQVTRGRAAALYREPAADVDAACGPASVPGHRIGFTVAGTCRINRLVTVPWVGGLGWARPGRTWLVVTAETSPPPQVFRRTDGTAFYSTRDDAERTAVLRYGTHRAVATGVYNDLGASLVDPDNPDQFVFDLAAGDDGRATPYTLTTRYEARTGDAVTPKNIVTLTATRTIAVVAR